MEDTSGTKKRKRDDAKDVYPCDKCEYLGSKKALNRHKQSKHEGIRYTCDQCEYAATRQDNLNMHKKSKHEGIRYPCDQCECTYSSLSDLHKHRKHKHEGIRYPCDQCEYVVTKQDQLKRHKQSKHEGIRYHCDQCEYIASSKSSLIGHKKFKHNVIRYPCDQCNYSTIQLSALKRHQVAIHKGNIKVNAVDPVFIETSDISVADTEIKEEDITGEDPLSYKPAIKEIDDKNKTIKHELEDEGVKREVGPFLATMDQDPLADAVKQEEDVLDIKIDFAEHNTT